MHKISVPPNPSLRWEGGREGRDEVDGLNVCMMCAYTELTLRGEPERGGRWVAGRS